MKFIDLTGNKYGMLTVLGRGEDYKSPNGKFHNIRWICECECGNKKLYGSYQLKHGEVKSCGCYRATRKFNDYTVENSVAYLKYKDKVILIDAEDLPKIRGESWMVSGNGYAYGNSSKRTMHSVIMGKKDGLIIDHINRNKLDNRKTNLRFTTLSVNGFNSTRSPGVTGEKYITKNGKYYMVQLGNKYIGCSKFLEKAIEMRNLAFENSIAKLSGSRLKEGNI